MTAVAVFMSFLDVTIVNIAFQDLRSDFAATSLPLLSWVINGYGVVFAAALIPAGRLGLALVRGAAGDDAREMASHLVQRCGTHATIAECHGM